MELTYGKRTRVVKQILEKYVARQTVRIATDNNYTGKANTKWWGLQLGSQRGTP